ncbi:MAG: ribosome-associated translation inhibitor RaiA [Proteobacteria bacterium]|nr:ribosome-associated translation inhibitor RaiA [Pseudomonadota bacterium]MDA1332168.1 ribosome-associated translation inhibitor RaiA [Pseudomonadota bacterium]
MNLSISAHLISVTPGIESHIRNKMSRVERHFDHPMDIDIMLTVSKHEHKAGAKLHFHGKDLFCESIELDLYKAIDDLAAKTDRKILKIKDRMTQHSTKSIRKLQMTVEPI